MLDNIRCYCLALRRVCRSGSTCTGALDTRRSSAMPYWALPIIGLSAWLQPIQASLVFCALSGARGLQVDNAGGRRGCHTLCCALLCCRHVAAPCCAALRQSLSGGRIFSASACLLA